MRSDDDGDFDGGLEVTVGWGDSLEGSGAGDGASTDETGDHWDDDSEPGGSNLLGLVDKGDGLA